MLLLQKIESLFQIKSYKNTVVIGGEAAHEKTGKTRCA